MVSVICRRFPLALFVMLLVLTASAQPRSWLRLSESAYSLAGDAVTFHGPGLTDTYVFGFGWLGGTDLEAPQLSGGVLSVSPQLHAALQGEAQPAAAFVPAAPAPARPFTSPSPQPPRTPLPSQAPPVRTPQQPLMVEAVRFGGSNQVRIVLDLPSGGSALALAGLAGSGRSETGSPLVLQLPGLLPPREATWSHRDVTLRFMQAGGVTQLELAGPPFAYEAFVLADPVRFVIDIIPLSVPAFTAGPAASAHAPAHSPGTSRQLQPGITYRQFRAPNGVGQSAVHLLEIAPGAGEFRVVGTSEVSRTLSELADGALAAINAGYFNTSTFEAIGLLRVDHGVRTLPTLNRASIGFGPEGTRIARVSALARISSAGRLLLHEPLVSGQLEVHRRAGSRAGSASQGVITVSNGRVTANRVGPLTVPADGFALVYAPETRALALLDPGEPLAFEAVFEPASFDAVRYAVEAGPLLVDHGRPAFVPELERFQRGQRILDEYTSQSAIGVKADGTVLMVIADNMRAEDLVPLFLSLDAWQAMRLDSGGSATLYADGKVLNRSAQRRIVSAIVLVPGL
jgi:hypothetical protein